MSSAAGVVRLGGCAVWALPAEARCARVAREVVRETLGALPLPEGMVDDAVTMVSELATNVFAHALGGRALAIMPTAGLPEVQIYGQGRGTEVVVRVFDSAAWCGTVRSGAGLRPPVDAEGGRGLELVNALAVEHRGRWGAHRSRSMLGSVPVSGKVVYFALPAAVAWSPPRRDCHEAARELRRLLGVRGIGPLHLSEGWRMAVLSVRAEITVWVRDETFFVTLPEAGALCRPVCDVVEVAETIVRCNEDLNARVRPVV
ncbi:ATP-binding protein [Actinomadura latina]|uniref:ATP-binding protein n=1 Tax=Actinomadura latina TaxID=163603 RepID=UPI000829FF51